jgi:hypothetical protein
MQSAFTHGLSNIVFSGVLLVCSGLCAVGLSNAQRAVLEDTLAASVALLFPTDTGISLNHLLHTRRMQCLFVLQAALLRDAVARINYEETGKKKALNFPDEEPPNDIMLRARMELEKARAKAAVRACTKPKAQSGAKVSRAVTLDPAQAAASVANIRQTPQPEHV